MEIKPNGVSHTCAVPEACGGGPDFGLYDERRVSAGDQEPEITWHDTIPVPDGLTVFIIIWTLALLRDSRNAFVGGRLWPICA
jgi:hypothetical protein